MKPETSLPWRVLKGLVIWVLGVLILFEEWGWVPLARLLGMLGRLPFVAWLERRIAALPPALALLVFLVPALMLLPVKIGALWLIGRGRAFAGLVVIVVAKVAGTALVARLYMLTQPQLMRMPWFARVHARWIVWKEGVMAVVRQSAPWRLARALKHRLQRWWRRP